MQYIFIISLVLLLIFDVRVGAIDEFSTFYKQRLERILDCKEFNKTDHLFARLDGFYKGHEPPSWYLDGEFQYSFDDCVKEIDSSEIGERQLIFKIRNRFDYSDKQFRSSIEEMDDLYPIHLKFIPEIAILLGPNGRANETASTLVNLKRIVVLTAPSEKEATNMAYTEHFFMEYYNRTLTLPDPEKYLQFNGWFLKNMRPPPSEQLLAKVFGFINVIIIYVEPKFSNRIGINQMRKAFGTNLSLPTIIYDTHDAPKYYSSAKFHVCSALLSTLSTFLLQIRLN